MAFAFVQSASAMGTTTATSIAVSFASNVTANNLIVCAVSWGSAGGVVEAPTSVADAIGNTLTRIPNSANVDATNDQQQCLFYKPSIAGGASSVTCTFPASRSNRGIIVVEYSGESASPLDQQTSNFQTAPGTTTDAVTTGSKTTTTAGQLIVGAYTDCSAGTGTTVTAGTGYTKRRDTVGAAGGVQLVVEDQIQVSAGAIAVTFTEALNHRALSSMATFIASGSVTLNPPQLLLTGVGA